LFQTLLDGKIEQAESGGIGPPAGGAAVGGGGGGGAIVAAAAGTAVGRDVGREVEGVAAGPDDGDVVIEACGGDAVPAPGAVEPGASPEPAGPLSPSVDPVVAPAVESASAAPPSVGLPTDVASRTGLGIASATATRTAATSGNPSQASRFPRMRTPPA
jgi:hypothetical protein